MDSAERQHVGGKSAGKAVRKGPTPREIPPEAHSHNMPHVTYDEVERLACLLTDGQLPESTTSSSDESDVERGSHDKREGRAYTKYGHGLQYYGEQSTTDEEHKIDESVGIAAHAEDGLKRKQAIDRKITADIQEMSRCIAAMNYISELGMRMVEDDYRLNTNNSQFNSNYKSLFVYVKASAILGKELDLFVRHIAQVIGGMTQKLTKNQVETLRMEHEVFMKKVCDIFGSKFEQVVFKAYEELLEKKRQNSLAYNRSRRKMNKK